MFPAVLWSEINMNDSAGIWRALETRQLRGIHVVVGSTNHQDFSACVCHLWQRGKIPLILAGNQTQQDIASLSPPPNAVIGFVTSGTTSSSPQVIWKTWRALNSEAQILIKTFNVTASSRILTLVPPIHIYGFLYGFLMPCLSRATLMTSGDWTQPLIQPDSLPDIVDVVVAVPPLWSLLERLLPRLNPRLVLSSGAPFGTRRAEAARTLRQHNTLSFSVVDVLGSTETGGIGYREVVGQHPEDYFTAFEGVHLIPPSHDSSPWSVVSPFTDDKTLVVGDIFYLSCDNRFQYRGRGDRVIKIGARRFSLAEIDAAVSSCAAGKPVASLFRNDPDSPKGGTLHVFIEGLTADKDGIIKRYQTDYPYLPIPAGIHVLEHLPRGAMGKSSRAELERCLD